MIRRNLREWLHDLRQMRVRGTFARNAAFAFSGTAVVTLSQLILAPLIANIYGPALYGIYGLFLAIGTNLGTIAELGLPQAYLLPRDEEKFLDLARLNILALAAVVLLLMPVLLLKDRVYALVPSWSPMGGWFYALPLCVAVQFLPVLATSWLARVKAFGHSASIGGATNLALRLFNAGYGALTRKLAAVTHGLMLGEILVRGLSLVVYWRTLLPHGGRKILGGYHMPRLLSTLREYRAYPLFIFPERWVSILGLQVPVFMLSGDSVAVGQFALASGLLLMPLRQFGYSLAQVFQQKAAETHREHPSELASITVRFYRRLLTIGLLPFTAVVFFGDVVFRWILGPEWVMSGVFAGYLGVFYLFRLLAEPMATLINVRRRERSQFIFQCMLFLFRVAAMMVGLKFLGSTGAAVLGYAGVSTIAYIAFSAYLLHLSGSNWRSTTLRSILLTCLALMLFAALRFALFGTWWPAP